MSLLLSLLVALVTGVLGLFCAGYFAVLCVEWYHITSREGASGYFVVGIALLGGFIASLLGMIVSGMFLFGNEPSLLKAMGWGVGMVLAISGCAIGFAYFLADIPPKLDGKSMRLELEFRLPVSKELQLDSADIQSSLELGSVVNHVRRAYESGQLKLDQARLEGKQWIVPGDVFLFTSRGLRSIHAAVNDETIGGFIVPLPARPDKRFLEWSKWGPQRSPNDSTVPDDKTTFRFRVQPID